jgi:hypothetical protein
MSFFNSKEEVLDVELTPYGKLLLSRGLFKPSYYSMHDDGVIYDSDYANVSENTNNAEVRIQDETPVHKPFYKFSESKPYLTKDINQEIFNSQKANLAIKKTNLPPSILSNSTISNLYVPSWEIYNLSSIFSTSSLYFTTTGIVSASIPQFDVAINTKFIKATQEQVEETPRLTRIFNSIEPSNILYDNDNIYFTINRPLILKIIENNIDIDYDAFELEVYKCTTDEDGNESYDQLKYSKVFENYDEQTDMYVANNQIRISQLEETEGLNVVDKTTVDYYFDCLTDKEISQINACKYILRSQEDQDLIFNDITICNELRVNFDTDPLYDEATFDATGKVC